MKNIFFNYFLKFYKILAITFIFFLIFDLILGKFIYKKFLRKNFIDTYNNAYIKSIYDHTLDSELDVVTGNIRHRLCTDGNGFRTFCNNRFNKNKSFDLAIIGDSMTYGAGLNYEQTYVGIFSKKIGEEKVANLGVVSYSPSIYYLKIKDLIKKNYKFKEVIIFIDLSDLVDETACYSLFEREGGGGDAILRRDTFSSCINLGIKFDKGYLISFSDKLMLSFEMLNLFQNFLISKNIVKKKPSIFQLNSPRSSWTYNYKTDLYNNYTLEDAKKLMIDKMELLYNLLNYNNIQMSIAVYPWPNTIYYDKPKNIHSEMWKNFCIDRCKHFYDFNHIFFEQLKTLSKDEVIIKNFLEGDVHFNSYGNELIGINFYKEFLEINNLK